MTVLIVAVVLIALSNVLMIFKISNLENGDGVAKLMKYTEESVRMANVNFDALARKESAQDADINRVIQRMDEIASSIERDHKDLVDIRERYILWREPKDSGVTWAKDYKCKEDE